MIIVRSKRARAAQGVCRAISPTVACDEATDQRKTGEGHPDIRGAHLRGEALAMWVHHPEPTAPSDAHGLRRHGRCAAHDALGCLLCTPAE